jgi:hypothetical protein
MQLAIFEFPIKFLSEIELLVDKWKMLKCKGTPRINGHISGVPQCFYRCYFTQKKGKGKLRKSHTGH